MTMLQDTNFLVFMIVSLVAGGLMQFYFLGSARFMMDTGIPAKNVPAAMAIAQVVQAVATYYLLNKFIGSFGFKWTLTIGAASWFLLYLVYVISKPRALIVLSQSLHGLAYVLFIIAGQIFANIASPPEIRSSVQALFFAATTGVGLFLGTQFAGIVMDIFKKEDKFNWRAIFAVPAVIMLVSIIVMIRVVQRVTEMKVLRIGIVGFGFMGRQHLNCYRALPRCSGGRDLRQRQSTLKSSEKIRGQYRAIDASLDLGDVALYTDFEKMLAEQKLDAVSITLPTFMHRDFTVKALEAGLHVLCEKPMAMNVEQCEDMIAAAKTNKKILQIGHCIRFWPEYAKAKEIVDSGKYGNVLVGIFSASQRGAGVELEKLAYPRQTKRRGDYGPAYPRY